MTKNLFQEHRNELIRTAQEYKDGDITKSEAMDKFREVFELFTQDLFTGGKMEQQEKYNSQQKWFIVLFAGFIMIWMTYITYLLVFVR